MRKNLITLLFALMAIAASAQNQRERINFDKDWQFAFGDASSAAKDFGCGTEYFNYFTKAASIHNEGPYVAKFDASGWARVDLPHDWVVDLPYAAEASHSHGYKQVGYEYPQTSVGWYRKTFTIPAEDYGKHLWLEFDGIFRDAQLWINGFYLGHEKSGYASQIYDISEYLNYGGENLLCVRVDATLEEGWFYEGAGIYRHVWLGKASKVNVAPWGTFAYSEFAAPFSLRGDAAPDLSQAALHIETTVQNSGNAPASYTLRHKLADAAGSIVGECEVEGGLILAKDNHLTIGAISVENPHLWSNDDPYLYTIITEVYTDGKLTDSYTTTTGIRHIAFDADRGFLLNGKVVKLKGVNMHQDHAGVGSGIPDALQEWRLLQLKKFGCNAYRSSHNPMTPALLDICDRLGILVIEENRLTGINKEHTELLGRMIKRDRNHPSIILWSVGNEEWGMEWNDFGTRVAESMREYCHRFDPTRLMTVASSSGPHILIPADVAGYNYILQNPVEEHRAKYPERRALGSEETTGCGTRGVYFDITDGREPSATAANLYTGETITINRNTTIRAIAFLDNGLHSTSVTLRYTVGTPSGETVVTPAPSANFETLVKDFVKDEILPEKFSIKSEVSFELVCDTMNALGLDASKAKLDADDFKNADKLTNEEMIYATYKIMRANKIIDQAEGRSDTVMLEMKYRKEITNLSRYKIAYAAMIEAEVLAELDFKPQAAASANLFVHILDWAQASL